MKPEQKLPLPYSEEWWRVTLASIGDGVIVTDTGGNVAFMNPVAESLTGWKNPEAKERSLEEVFPIIDELNRERLASPIGKVVQTGAVVEVANHTVLLAKDGSEVLINDSAAPIKDQNGNVLGVVVVFRDVSESKRAQAVQSRLAAIIESSSDAILGEDMSGNITTWNRGAEALYGYTAAEIVGRPVSLLTPPERGGELAHIFSRLKHGEVIDHYDTVRCAKDGRCIDVSLTISPIRDAAGQIIGASSIARDITEQKRAAAERAYLAAIVESSDDAIVGKTLNSVITSWNRAAERMFGYSAAEAIGQTIYLIIPPQRHGEEPEILARLSRGERIEHFETVRCRKDGGLLDVSLTISPIRDQAGRVIGASKVARDITEKKHAETERAYLAAIVEFSDDAIVGKTLDSVITSWNRAAERMFGYTAAEAIGKQVYFIIPPERQFEEPEILARLSRGERIEHFETVRRRKDGSLIDVSLTISAIRDSTGRVIGASKVARDITDKKRAETERAYLAAIVESSDDAIVSKTLGSVITSWNLAAERMFGYSATEAVGRQIYIIIPPERYSEETEILARLKRGEFINHYETVRRKKDGTLIDVSLTVSPIQDASGNIIGASKIARDITDRKQAEAQLRESHEALESINRVGQMLSSELDLEKVVQTLTDAATAVTRAAFGSFFYNVADKSGASCLYAMSGVPRQSFENFPMPRATDLFAPTFRAEGVVRIADVNHDPRYGRNSPYFGMPEGHLPVTSYLAVPVLSRSAEVLGGLFLGHPAAGVFSAQHEEIVKALARQAASAMDNARLYEAMRKARTDAETANRLKDEFLATVSHELRTPLNAIFGWARLLQMGQLDDASRIKAVETIERNAKAQSQIIEDILDVSRIITGKLRLDVAPVEMGQLIAESVESLRPTADAKGIRLQMVLDTKASLIWGDVQRLQQILWNLLSNAVKFTPKGGRVQVTLSRPNSHLEIAVRDTGKGIGPEFLPHVFDRFSQADSSTKRNFGGLGLGLAIVRHLTELHGGTVTADSPGPGEGATFTLRLPVAVVRNGNRAAEEPAPPAQPAVHGQPAAGNQLHGVRVLVVDDEADARELLRTVLERSGAQIKTAASSREAYDILQDWRPDVLLSDIGMADEDGYELIRRVRALPHKRGGSIPAAALTAYATAEDRLSVLTAGFQTHIAKPVEPLELTAIVAVLAGRTGTAKDR
jgi:PAS domain S-box-containing protein